MRASKIVLLVFYILFMIGFLANPIVLKNSSAEASAISMTVLVAVSAVVMGILGGIVAHRADRSVAGWVVGCFFVPWVCPLVLALLKDKEMAATASRASPLPAAAGSPNRQARLSELSNLKEKGILNDEEYAKAVAKVQGGKA